ncbi:MAG: bifunctional phosphopantothenoylcysteine decarboxylase/phosphopantothenate--cysteine ligase CoaBC [Mailhella sp.]|nr:bifunctional phosphopantothenoylcysteine decarboxylase/phosphopantothenate--cysteine ligase CoaBC [Mailhella sp.]
MNDAFPAFPYYNGKRLHIGVCGSVAAYKLCALARRFKETGLDVGATLTESAARFVTPLTFSALGADPVYTQMFGRDNSVFAHLEPGQTSQLLLIAPATAATMARLAAGMADEILSCQTLAFDGPVLLAPAMNAKMWANPATQANKEKLQELGFFFIEPSQGKLACGETGQGRLADEIQIYYAALKLLTEPDMFGKKVLITLGPTREAWDAVRFWTNGSSGAMGHALALAAWLRGAEVYVVSGPVSQTFPDSDGQCTVLPVTNAEEMFRRCDELWPEMDMGIFTAAVADFRPIPYGTDKFKKEGHSGFSIEFAPNTDILLTLGAEKNNGQRVMGFAAETGTEEDLKKAARRKLEAKNCDMLVGNRVSDGFGTDSDKVFVTDINGNEESLPVMPKTALAWELLTRFLMLG